MIPVGAAGQGRVHLVGLHPVGHDRVAGRRGVRGPQLHHAVRPGFGAGPKTGLQGTRGQLLMHEIGHAVGLGHPKIKDKWEIMYPTMTRKPAVYGKGDQVGLRALGTGAGCLYARDPSRPS
ncbi:hypothetical protein ACFQX7_35395 [Luedemannella flava]